MDVKMKLKWLTVKNRVANAYHDYGRLCAAHPLACLAMSLLTMIVLSYPAVTRLRLPVSTPIDVFWSEHLHANEKIAPSWINENPASYIQQFIVTATVEPWNSTLMMPEQAVRAAVEASFKIREILLEEKSIDESCLHLTPSSSSNSWPFRSRSICLILSPASIWFNNLEKFQEDENVIQRILNEECKSTFCMRDLLLGAPISATGIKERYTTNRKRSIEFAVTIFFARYNKNLIENIRNRIGNIFQVVKSSANDESTFVQVYFHPLKKFVDYSPLIFTYFLCMIYLYFSSRKFEMVASRWGLAFAASFTVAATLLMTTGICAHLDMSTTLWGAELYPYIALILGLENILCITRSVVYTPPSLDVSSRIAHGLSQEGYKLTKYFVLELFSLICGYLTQVSDIQEFCQFSAICIIIDFYMQLFFYAPCLTFDMQRLGLEEKRRFAEMLFYAEIPRLKNFAAVNCPMRKVWPKLFELKKVQKRRFSDSGVDEIFMEDKKGQRRLSTKPENCGNGGWKDDSESETSHRMRILYFITRTRIIQRTIMIIFAIWTVWLAFFVGSRNVTNNNFTMVEQNHETLSQTHRILSAAQLKYGHWQRRTYKWWPAVAHEYNITLSSRYVTFLPPIVINAQIPANNSNLWPRKNKRKEDEQSKVEQMSEEPILRSRIDWLETQLKMYLAAFWLLLLTTVVIFFAYVCLSDRWKIGTMKNGLLVKNDEKQKENLNTTSKQFVETLPIVFNGHCFPIETIGIDKSSPNFVSCCQEGVVLVWNSESGERICRLNRLRTLTATLSSENLKEIMPKIWSIAKKDDIIVLGCADGSVEIASLIRNKLIGIYTGPSIGVTHIVCKNDGIVVGRLDGSVEFVAIQYENKEKIRVRDIKMMRTVRAHQKAICRMVTWNDEMIITSSFDRSIKMWKWTNGEMVNVFLAHNSPVVSLAVDEKQGMMYSSCEEGVICWWNLMTGELIRTVDNNCSWSFQLTTSSEYLLGFYASFQLFIWSLDSGQLISRVTDASMDGQAIDTLYSVGSNGVVALDDNIAATASGYHVTFWDLKHRAIIGKVNVGGKIGSMRKVKDNNVLCGVGNSMYLVTVPMARIK